MNTMHEGIDCNPNSNGQIILKLSKRLYEKESVFAALYKFENQCAMQMEPIGEAHIEVIFRNKAGGSLSEQALAAIADEFCNELIDQQVRRDLEKRFGKLRELIVEHAFSPITNLEERVSGNV
jgi:His-Xaa-Ser system protein HxsD